MATWDALGGSTLRTTVMGWADKAQWIVRWPDEGLDYPIEVGFVMEGEFVDVISATFDLYRTAKRRFSVTLHPSQRLVRVEEKQ